VSQDNVYYSVNGRDMKIKRIKGDKIFGIWLDNHEEMECLISQLEPYIDDVSNEEFKHFVSEAIKRKYVLGT